MWRFSYPCQRAAVAHADVTSANIVGYQLIPIAKDWSFKTVTFKQINGGELKLKDLHVVKPDGTEWQASGNTTKRTFNEIRLCKLKANGDYDTQYSYTSKLHSEDGKTLGWIVGISGEERAPETVTFSHGEGMIIECLRSDTPNFMVSGEVTLTEGRILPLNWSFSGNFSPVKIKLNSIVCLKHDGTEWQASGNTTKRTFNEIRISKIKSNGDYGTQYSYTSKLHSQDGKTLGWIVGISGEERVPDDVELDAGEGFIVECLRSDGPILMPPNPMGK